MLRLLSRKDLDLGEANEGKFRDVSGIVVLGNVEGGVHQYVERAQPLTIGFRPLGPHQDPLEWLHWKSRMAPTVVGRDREMASLREWATEGRAVRARVLMGEGGTGKTRLAAELAEELRGEGWEAGFAALRKVGEGGEVYKTGSAGTLILLDYPEEHREATRELLADLASLETEERLRILLLSRRGDELWQSEIDQAGAFGLFDEVPLELRPLKAVEDLYEIFQASAAHLARTRGNEPPAPVERAAFGEWLQRESEHHRPLYVVAAAIEAALDPGRTVVDLSGQEVILALARREIRRLANESRDAGLPSKAFPRLMALAAIAGGLTTDDIRRLAQEEEILELGLPAPKEAVAKVTDTGRFVEGENTYRLPAPAPDIVAAALVIEVMHEPTGSPSERLWAAIQGDIHGGLERIGRLAYDAEMTLGLDKPRIGDCLKTALTDHPERCAAVAASFYEVTLPYGLRQAAPLVWEGLLGADVPEQERAELLNNLSVHLAAAGDSSGALKATEQAVEIYGRFAASNPGRYEPDLALSLNNLSSRLFETGDPAGGLKAIEHAVEIDRRLAASNPGRYEPELASSLNNLSIWLSETGDPAGALEAIEQAVEIYGRLAASNPGRYEAELASCLHNLSIRLSERGEPAGALKAIEQAVEIRRRLAASNPGRYEPELASSLNNLSVRLSETGDPVGALKATEKAVEIYSRLAASNPRRYEPDLGQSLNNLSVDLSAAGDSSAALKAIEQAVEIRRRLAASNPGRYEQDLAQSLNNLSVRLSETGDPVGALESIKQAVEIRHRLTTSNPVRYEPDLARSLSVRSDRLAEVGQIADALDAAREASALIQPYAERWPDGPHGRLGRVIENDIRRLEERLSEGELPEGAGDPDSTPSP
jgi:hypothetical protein